MKGSFRTRATSTNSIKEENVAFEKGVGIDDKIDICSKEDL
jgi:hypothetical protein